jgi:hypothetical protein
MVVVGALLGAAVAGFSGWHLWDRSPASGPDGRITVAVADFVNETKDGDLDGLSGQLITSLEQSQKLRVLTRSRMVDVLRLIGKPSVPVVDEVLGREMALAAGVRALVVATIRRPGHGRAAPWLVDEGRPRAAAPRPARGRRGIRRGSG